MFKKLKGLILSPLKTLLNWFKEIEREEGRGKLIECIILYLIIFFIYGCVAYAIYNFILMIYYSIKYPL